MEEELITRDHPPELRKRNPTAAYRQRPPSPPSQATRTSPRKTKSPEAKANKAPKAKGAKASDTAPSKGKGAKASVTAPSKAKGAKAKAKGAKASVTPPSKATGAKRPRKTKAAETDAPPPKRGKTASTRKLAKGAPASQAQTSSAGPSDWSVAATRRQQPLAGRKPAATAPATFQRTACPPSPKSRAAVAKKMRKRKGATQTK